MKLFKIHLSSLLFIFYIFLNSSITYAANKNNLVETFIKNQSTIRIAMSDSGGYGDLTSSLNVMERLKEMGFSGTFEVIYPDESTNKIINLFNLPANIDNEYEDTKNKIRFIKLHEFMRRNDAHATELIPFGMTGAIWFNEYVEQPGKFKNLANFLNVKTFAWTNPWVKTAFPPQIDAAYNLIFTPNREPIRFDESNSYVIAPIVTLTQVDTYLTEPQGKTLLQKDPALPAFIDGMKKQNFNVLPAYGWPINKNINEQYDQDSSPGNILQIIAGARYAQLNGPMSLRNKPLIIAVFYDYKDEAKQLEQAIYADKWEWENKTDVGIAQVRNAIRELGLNQQNVFATGSLSSIETISQIQNLKAGQIFLLSMGPLPKIVFDGLYSHTAENILPQIREGMGSLSSLITTGKPHMRCGDHAGTSPVWDLGYDLVIDSVLKNDMQHFYNYFCDNMQTWQNDPEIYKDYGNLIIEAQYPHSALSLYFTKLKKEASKPENDRIYRAIEEAMQLNKIPK